MYLVFCFLGCVVKFQARETNAPINVNPVGAGGGGRAGKGRGFDA